VAVPSSKGKKAWNEETTFGHGPGEAIVERAEAGMPEPEPTGMYLPAYRR